MKYLTEQEIKFLKDTGLTMTVLQCDEWDRCEVKSIEEATLVANRDYNISFRELVSKLRDGDDWISLEYAASYLFYIFFTLKELEKLTDKEGLKFLQDFKYYFGWRKADEQDARRAIEDAKLLHTGDLILIDLDGDGDVWTKDNCPLGEYDDD